jgi:hypothetical protein
MYSLPSVKTMALNTAKAQQLFSVFGSETTRLDKAGGVREGRERGEVSRIECWNPGNDQELYVPLGGNRHGGRETRRRANSVRVLRKQDALWVLRVREAVEL